MLRDINKTLWREWCEYRDNHDPREYLTYAQWLECEVLALRDEINAIQSTSGCGFGEK